MYKKLNFNNSSNYWQKILQLDWILLIIIATLCFIGTGALYSAADGNWSPWALNHFYRCCFGLFIILFISILNPNLYLKYSYYFYFLCIASLIYVHFFGVGNVKRWIDLKFMFFQPSEITKIALVLFLAKYFSDPSMKFNKVLYYFIPFLAVVVPSLIVMNQPDLGTGFMILFLGVSIIFLVGLPWKIVFFLFFSLLASIPLIWQQLYEYQKHRILVFLNPQLDNLGSGYQIMQSKIAIGSGGFFGQGYLLGSQSRLEFLPEKHTDFVFTLIAEEMGFIGSSILVSLFLLLIILIMRHFLKQTLLTGKIIIFGIAFLFFLYVSLNIGMVSGLIPVVGAPLPFISHGGTTLLTVFVSLGVVQSIKIHQKDL